MSDGLNLGRISFPPGYDSYTPPERRGRRRRRGGRTTLPRPIAPQLRTGSPLTDSAWLSITTESGGSEHVPFLGRQRERSCGALGASVVSHTIVIVVAILVVRLVPPTETFFEPDRTNYNIVWIPQEGPGGGGGGGGNASVEMPRQVEVAGEDDVSVPAAVLEEVHVPAEVKPEPQEQPLKSLRILSTLPLAAAPRTRAGLLQGLMARSFDSQGSGQGDGLGPGQGGGTGGGTFAVGNGVSSPKLIRRVKPKYTAQATRAKIQGSVVLDAVVQPDGSVDDVTVLRSLDRVFGLDQAAVEAAKEWRFLPGTRFGEPVAVYVRLAIEFRLL